MNINDIIGVAGVSMLLLAYFLSLFKFISNNSLVYILLNVFGAAIGHGLAMWRYLKNVKPGTAAE